MSVDRTGVVDPISINLVPGSVAPRFDAVRTELRHPVAVITEQGTSRGLPIVDLQFTDDEGNRYVFITSGRILLGLAAAIRGVNLRNHGNAEP